MKIIKRGTIQKPIKKFECMECGTVFLAEYGEYQNANQIEYCHDGIEAKCICPVCGKMVWIDKKYQSLC